MKKILLIGGGGHCKSVADAVIRASEYDDIGIVDINPAEPLFGSIKIVSSDDNLPALLEAGWTDAFVTVGSIGNTKLRRKLYSCILKEGFQIPNIVDPSAVVSIDAHLGKGVFVGKNAVINAGSIIGNAAIINTGAIVEHDCHIGDFVHVSPRAVICGGVEVGNDTHVGAGSVIKQYLNIGENIMIGMGSVVINDITSSSTVVGNPAKIIRGDCPKTRA